MRHFPGGGVSPEEASRSRGVGYAERDIVLDNPAADELRAWYEASGLPLKRPLLVLDAAVLVGFREKEWAAALD